MSWGAVDIALDNASSELTHTNEHSLSRGSARSEECTMLPVEASVPSLRAQKALRRALGMDFYP